MGRRADACIPKVVKGGFCRIERLRVRGLALIRSATQSVNRSQCPSRPKLSSTELSRASRFSLPVHLLLTGRLGLVFAALALASILVLAIGCSSEEEPTAALPSPTIAPTPEATEPPAMPEPTIDMANETSASNGEITKDDVLATAFDEWGSTCLNNAYPTQAPQFDEVVESDYSTDANGLQFVTLKEGEGATPKLTWEVDVQYTGWLDDGCIFDSSYTRSEPAVFPVNAVIPGWQMTITQMKVGERRRVVIPPDLAYGAAGSPPVIPGNATLIFDVILINGTDPEAANIAATQVADDLLAQATVEAREFDADAAGFDPVLEDYVNDVEGFLRALPVGEVTCMTAYAGGPERLAQVFTVGSQPPTNLLVHFDECLSDTTTRNIAAGRINIIGADLSSDTLSCIGETLENPTLKPLFGIFDATEVSEQWITAHFCLDQEERDEFEKALFANQPNRTPIGSGKTFIDVQECMVDELGAASYFAPVVQPDTADSAAMDSFFTNFTPFMIADIKCRQGEAGHQMEDGSMMTEDAASCAVDELGVVRFGEVFLDRIWVPTNEEHFEAASTFSDCGTPTDFLNLPTSLGNVENTELSCLLEELDNADEPSQTSVRAFTQIGSRNSAKAGDFVALLFGSQTCGIELSGIPDGAEITDTSAMCILDKVDQSLYASGLATVNPAFDEAVANSADCLAGQ